MAEDVKLKIDNMMVMILISLRYRSKTLYIRRSFRRLWQKPNLQRTKTGAEDTIEGRKQNRNNSKSWKIGDIKGKEVNVTARDSDDALVYCIKNTVEGRIMDSSASFHATYCKDELERFKLRSGKVRLVNDKTLDIAGVGDVVLKTSFGTSWTLKVVKYIPSLKRRLISVGQLDEEGTDAEPLEQVQYDTDDNVFANDIHHFEQSESISNTCAVEMGDSNVIPDSPDMCDNDIQDVQNDVECDDERVALANLIANLKLDVDENKKIQKTLGESNSIRDSCLVALQNKQTGLEGYMAFNNRTVDIKEGLKVKAYEISVVKEKHDGLVKQSLLNKSHYEGLVKEKTKV
ncbi:hypothetical protein Tco_1324232, partial [Tanacetum coccineum]